MFLLEATTENSLGLILICQTNLIRLSSMYSKDKYCNVMQQIMLLSIQSDNSEIQHIVSVRDP